MRLEPTQATGLCVLSFSVGKRNLQVILISSKPSSGPSYDGWGWFGAAATVVDCFDFIPAECYPFHQLLPQVYVMFFAILQSTAGD